MYRVLLKIDRVSLRVKQLVDLHIIIKKKQQFFTHCKHQKLINGTLALDKTSEFFISIAEPSFDIDIYLIVAELKKKGGNVQLNLSNYAINTSHRITAIIQNTPLHNSTLLLDFAYMNSDQPTANRSLLSIHQLEEMKHKQSIKQITESNQTLLLQNELLTQKITALKQKNGILTSQTNQIIQENQRHENQFQVQRQKMEEQKSQYYKTILNEKKKMAEIVDIINETGNGELINEMGDIIHKREPKLG